MSQPETKSLTLHDLLDTLSAMENSLECAESEEERAEIESSIASLLEKTEHKTDAYAGLIRREEKCVEEGRELISAAQYRLKVREARIARIKQRAMDTMRQHNVRKLEGLTAVISRMPGRESVVIEDAASIPPAYCTVVPEQVVPNKTEIKKALKAGVPIGGARLVTGEEILSIR